MHSLVVHAAVFVTDKSQSKIFEQWYNRRETQRSYRSGNGSNFHLVLRGHPHTENSLSKIDVYCTV